MPFRFFSVPASDDGAAAELLNQFLRRVKVVAIERQLLPHPGAPAWVFCIEFQDGATPAAAPGGRGAERIDYRAILPADAFARYARLRTARKRWGEEAGVPLYAVFTNEQLAEIAKRVPTTITELKSIAGIGDAKIAAWGERVLSVAQQADESAATPST
jgi:superfamily II DNA helicase RecQ